MNYLGRGWGSCLLGLRDYHRSILRTRVRSRTARDAWQAREQLQHLLFDIEVDVAARSGAAGDERMTAVERAVFYPMLLRLRDALARASVGAAPESWSAALSRALSIVRAAVTDLREWQANPRSRRSGARLQA
jgi:hypothetical protein